MSGEGTYRWYVVRTKPRMECLAAATLRSRRVDTYFPKLVLGSWSRRGDDSGPTEPLFPGYLFVRVCISMEHARVAWTPGIRGFVSFGDGVPDPIDDSVIALLRERAGGGEMLRPRDPLRPGGAVEVRSGPFAGLLGIIDRPVSGSGRIQVLLEILRRKTRVDLSADQVVAL